MKRLVFSICVVVLAGLVGSAPADEPFLHLKVDLGLIHYESQTVKPGWIPWVQPRWYDMYGHDCVLANGTGEDASCGDPFYDKPGLGGSGVMAGMTCVYEGRGGLIASGPEMCALNGDCPVTGQVLYEPICNTWFQITDYPGVPGANILLALYNLPASEYTLKSYHNKFGGERNYSRPHWEDLACPENPLNSVTAVAIAGAEDLFSEYGGNYEWPKLAGQYDLGSPTGVELIEGDYGVVQQQVTRDEELIPSEIRFRTNGSAVLVVYEGTCCVPDDIRPARDSGRSVLNAFELILDEPIMIAGLPKPADGAEDVPPDVVLNWSPCPLAVWHDVYLGTDEEAVRNAADPNTLPGRGRHNEASYDPGGLKLGTTYYWRVDEVGDVNAWEGPVWSFTTVYCNGHDDFESYQSSGDLQAAVGAAGGGWLELSTSESHEGSKSLELQYFNKSGFRYSEFVITFDQPKDWVLGGVEAIGLYFKGKADNGEDNMYAAVEDARGVSGVIRRDGNMEDVKNEEWQLWGAEVAGLVGVDLSAVKKLSIGVGDRSGPVRGVEGSVYFDDIMLCMPSCTSEIEIPTDFTSDCLVNFEDHAVMAREWGKNDSLIKPVAPRAGSLMGWYKFDETSGLTAADSSGHGYDGTVYQEQGIPNPRWEQYGKFGGNLLFPIEYGVLVVDPDNPQTGHLFSEIDKAVTISVWVYGYTYDESKGVIFQAGEHPDAQPSRRIISIYVYNSTGGMEFATGLGEADRLDVPAPETWTKWNHYAFVKDAEAGYQRVYLNGCLLAEKEGTRASMAGIVSASIGMARHDYGNAFGGNLDDFRVYNYALSQAEIVEVMAKSKLYCPLVSIANLSDDEPIQSKVVNFKDYAVFAESWLEEELWP